MGLVQHTGIGLDRESPVTLNPSDRSSFCNLDVAVNSEPQKIKLNVTFSSK